MVTPNQVAHGVEGDSGYVDALFEKMEQRGDLPAIVWRDDSYSYRTLLSMVDAWQDRFREIGIDSGSSCGVLGNYSPEVCALILALMKIGATVVPFTRASAPQVPELARLASVNTLFKFEDDDAWSVEPLGETDEADLITEFKKRGHSGLVVFTSGSTGQPKGILHDCEHVLRKFSLERTGYRTLLFLLMDHFGGFNTLISVFSYGGTAVIAANNRPDEVCRTIQQAKVELLPVTPTFLNLLLVSKCYEEFDLSSVKLITYGTEVMTDSTLGKVTSIFPSARLQQTYGLSELGVLRSKSKDSDSVWVKVGGEGFETKIVDDMLYVRSQSAMVGYLNEPSPFDEDGWMNTGDLVEVDGEYLRILGRQSEMINVGGQKVLPVEVETVLLDADNILDATVYGVPNQLMGASVAARVSLEHEEDPVELKGRLRKFCLGRLTPYKVPIRFVVVSQSDQYNERSKKVRQFDPEP